MSETENKVREAVSEGAGLRERVRDITLEALSQRRLNTDAVREVIEQVTEGVIGGVGAQSEQLQSSLKEALAGVDDALEKTAEAAKLAAEEALGRANEFSDHDLKTVLQELATLEDLFVDTLRNAAQQTGEVASQVLTDLAEHLKVAGTQAGAEAREAVDSLRAQLKAAGRDAAVEAAQAGKQMGEKLAQIASGFLAGMADALQAKSKRD